ncbi:MAG TPA: hypothetical protein K8V52_12275 [Enterococcus faecalis]|nr:hypothetical protein [Enterococcus faecalis]
MSKSNLNIDDKLSELFYQTSKLKAVLTANEYLVDELVNSNIDTSLDEIGLEDSSSKREYPLLLQKVAEELSQQILNQINKLQREIL